MSLMRPSWRTNSLNSCPSRTLSSSMSSSQIRKLLPLKIQWYFCSIFPLLCILSFAISVDSNRWRWVLEYQIFSFLPIGHRSLIMIHIWIPYLLFCSNHCWIKVAWNDLWRFNLGCVRGRTRCSILVFVTLLILGIRYYWELLSFISDSVMVSIL